jgi:hypothetical protein
MMARRQVGVAADHPGLLSSHDDYVLRLAPCRLTSLPQRAMSDSSKILSRFPWLASVPHSSKTLTWQPDLVAQVKTRSTSRRVVSVLDDRVVFIANAKAGDETWVFYAELKEDGAESVVCERVAVLPLKVDMIALLPRKTGEGNPEFVTLKADTGCVALSHAHSGTD